MNIFVGNLSTEASEDDLRQAAEAFGQVASVSVASDDAGQSKGFGFIEMSAKAEGQALIAGLNGQDIKGQAVKVSEARPQADRTGAKGKQSWSNRGGFAGRERSNVKGSKETGSKGGFSMGKTSGHKV